MGLLNRLVESSTLISRNAEADVYLVDGFLGRPAILKIRVPKGYRDERLDRRLRQMRSYREAVILHRLRDRGLPVPMLYFASLRDGVLIMEYIEGIALAQALSRLELEDAVRYFSILGGVARGMHGAGVIHGDLNLNNILVRDGDLWLIDFGLSYWSDSPKDMAVDLDSLRRSLDSTVPSLAERLFEEFLNSYREGNNYYDEVLRFYSRLRRMGRYYAER